ncbi:MAG: rhamnulokinase [Oscillospiraceae bacterium]|nr:rhamnulokinase [Oscillospiraceae bacterium]
MNYYLAVDIGASSGRHIRGCLDNGRLILKEIHRFPNDMTKRGDTLCWDTDALIAEANTGLQKCAALGTPPHSAGIDTWGVDFVLTDRDGSLLGDSVAYRDSRTDGMDIEVERLVPYDEHFARTGIQKQPFNTVYQLMALKLKSPGLLERADSLLLIPDYLHYRIYGGKRSEYTHASTTGLVSALTRDWDWDIIERLGFPRGIFQPVVHGLTPSHDTASAFMAVPAKGDGSVYISSGTWSLLGVVSDTPILSEAARKAGFSNEGGYGGTYRFLKNIMGLWMIQSVRREMKDSPSYAVLENMARDSDYDGLVDVNDAAFFAPESMTRAIELKCVEAGYPRPDGAADIVRCVYSSLARAYADSIKELEALTGKRYTSIHIIGGGSQDDILNKLTAQAAGLPVYAGPAEGTALGNIVSQMLRSGELPGIQAAHEAIRNSFTIKEVLP